MRKKDMKSNSNADKFIDKVLNKSPDFSRGESRITFEVGNGMLIEGFRCVCEYTENRLIISTCSRNVIIEGCCLCICCMMEDSIAICGDISAVKFA